MYITNRKILILLCTDTVSSINCTSEGLRAGETKVPLQLYLPFWKVLNGLKVKVERVAVPVLLTEIVIPFLLMTATPPVVQVAIGELIRPRILDTVQVRL